MNTDNPTTSTQALGDSALGPTGSIRDAAWARIASQMPPVFAVAGVARPAVDELVTHIGNRLTQESIPHREGELLTVGFRHQLTGSVVTLDLKKSPITVDRLVKSLRHARRDAHCIFVVLPGERGASLARSELSHFLVEGDNLVTVDPSSTKA